MRPFFRRAEGPSTAGLGLAVLAVIAVVMPTRAPVVSALTGEPTTGAALQQPLGYLALAPLFGVWDFLTVLTVPQHIQVFATLFLVYFAWRVLRRKQRLGPVRRTLAEVGMLAASVVALLLFYGAGVLAYRPMARLVVADPDVVVVDFHSHTLASHDGRWDFNIDRNRAWHRGAGVQVAFVADHDSVGPALRAAADNPVRAGDGTVILPAREVRYQRQHVVALGTTDPREGAGSWTPDPAAPRAPHAVAAPDSSSGAAQDVDGVAEGGTGGLIEEPTGPRLPARWCEGWPVLIQTIPNDLGRVPVPACGPDGAGVEAIELLDGDPRGLEQSDRERARILAIADSLDLALVSAANLHGWGQTAASWNLVRIPGWRDMTPDTVGARIEAILRHGPRSAVEVVAYRRPPWYGAGPLAAVAGTVALPVSFVAQRSRPERVSWLLWIGVGLLARGWWVRRRASAAV